MAICDYWRANLAIILKIGPDWPIRSVEPSTSGLFGPIFPFDPSSHWISFKLLEPTIGPVNWVSLTGQDHHFLLVLFLQNGTNFPHNLIFYPTLVLEKWVIMSYNEPHGLTTIWFVEEVYKALHISSHFRCGINVKGFKERKRFVVAKKKLESRTLCL